MIVNSDVNSEYSMFKHTNIIKKNVSNHKANAFVQTFDDGFTFSNLIVKVGGETKTIEVHAGDTMIDIRDRLIDSGVNAVASKGDRDTLIIEADQVTSLELQKDGTLREIGASTWQDLSDKDVSSSYAQSLYKKYKALGTLITNYNNSLSILL